jgi:hypothetical protein
MAGSRGCEACVEAPVGLAFFDLVELVGFDVVECLLCAAGPADLNGLDPSGFAETEVCAQVALG